MRLNKSTALSAVLLLSTVGCATTSGVSNRTDKSDLGRWLNEEAVPYLTEELGNSPRFSGASVQLVHLDGEVISPDMDALSEELRRELFDALLGTPGVDLAVRPTVQPWRAHRTLSEVDCGIMRPVTHVVGLDLRDTVSNGQRVTLRALDLQANQWVSGFEKSWNGTLTPSQLAAAKTTVTDSSLRGLRQLPFQGDQVDLTASYLAQNVSCLLRQGAPERLKLFITPPPNDAPAFFKKINTIIGRYMNQYREVDVVKSAESANAVVDSSMLNISKQLWQVWMGVTFTENAQQVSGSDTPAYVQISETALFDNNRLVVETPTGLGKPEERWTAPAKPTNNTNVTAANRPNTPTASTSASTSSSTPASSSSGVSNQRKAKASIGDFNALIPNDMSLCSSSEPWGVGESALGTNTQLTANDCFAISATFQAQAVFLITQTGEGGWYRMVGSECQSPQFSDPKKVASEKALRFPATGSLVFTGQGDTETYYLIAAASKGSQDAVVSVVNTLPDACGEGSGASSSPLPAIRQAIKAHNGELVMRPLSVKRGS